MAQYRKKPVVIEAKQLTEESMIEVISWLQMNKQDIAVPNEEDSKIIKGIIIETLEGGMLASMGDYIIQGVNGEFYPCKPDIFEKTYEAVNKVTIM